MRVVVTGGFGFLGRHVCARLKAAGHEVIAVSRRSGHDLRDPARARAAMADARIVVHLAARLGGGEDKDRSGLFSDNIRMGMNVATAAAEAQARLLVAGTAASYPQACPTPFVEEEFSSGPVALADAPYGEAKRALLVFCQVLRAEKGLSLAYLVFPNLYGPGCLFHGPGVRLVGRMVAELDKAREEGCPDAVLKGWGAVSRSLLYVEDAAEAVVRACRSLDDDQPVNIPGGEETTLAALADRIASLVGYTGKISWDGSWGKGQPRRALDGRRAAQILAWTGGISLNEGLLRTVEWFRS